MGWYMDPDFDWESFEGSAPTCSLNNKSKAGAGAGAAAPACSLSNKPKGAAPPAAAAASKKEETQRPSGNTACPLPADSPPPPPPPDVDSIYHLCQKSKWEEAVESRQPYFPPTYMNDGKFTRATVYTKDLVSTANEYYDSVPGDWIVLELDCKMLYSLGIPILAQDAPESTPKQPVKCLQVFGGISTNLPGLVKNIYRMHRAPNGRFIRMVDTPVPIEEEKKEESPKKKEAAPKKRGTSKKKEETPKKEPTAKRLLSKLMNK